MPGRKKKNPDLHVPTPVSRKLQVYAVDPNEAHRAIAERLGMSFEYRATGHGMLGTSLAAALRRHQQRHQQGTPAWAH